jgi:RNA polymerase sigma-70 factor (ECF subfamily)
MSAKSNTPAEFVSLVHQHQAIVHRICRVYATDVHDRDDLYQEIVMQAWQAFHSFRGQARFSTWLYRVGLNTALLRNRKRPDRQPVSLQDNARFEPADNRREYDDPDVELLYESIQQLPKLDRAIVLLHLERHGYQEIADITGISRTNVSVRLVRLKTKLRQLMLARKSEGAEDDDGR